MPDHLDAGGRALAALVRQAVLIRTDLLNEHATAADGAAVAI